MSLYQNVMLKKKGHPSTWPFFSNCFSSPQGSEITPTPPALVALSPINLKRKRKKKKEKKSLVITSNKKDCEWALTALHILQGPKAG